VLVDQGGQPRMVSAGWSLRRTDRGGRQRRHVRGHRSKLIHAHGDQLLSILSRHFRHFPTSPRYVQFAPPSLSFRVAYDTILLRYSTYYRVAHKQECGKIICNVICNKNLINHTEKDLKSKSKSCFKVYLKSKYSHKRFHKFTIQNSS